MLFSLKDAELDKFMRNKIIVTRRIITLKNIAKY